MAQNGLSIHMLCLYNVLYNQKQFGWTLVCDGVLRKKKEEESLVSLSRADLEPIF